MNEWRYLMGAWWAGNTALGYVAVLMAGGLL